MNLIKFAHFWEGYEFEIEFLLFVFDLRLRFAADHRPIAIDVVLICGAVLIDEASVIRY